MLFRLLASAGLLVLTILPAIADVRGARLPIAAPYMTPVKYTFVGFPKNNSIQQSLISTFPVGLFKTDAIPAIPFNITPLGDKCGTYGKTGTAACNYFAFGFNASAHKLILKTSIPGATTVYSLMNAFQPVAGKQLGYVVFFGSKGARAAFALIAGSDIRDFYYGGFTNTLMNSVANEKTLNAFSCIDPKNCRGAGGSGNVATGNAGTYLIDEQAYKLPAAFLTQNLIEIAIVDSYDGSAPILLGLTVAS